MKLTRLRLLGFKSFVEPTDFLIEPGLTGVVGPNGCGKSNLVEALRWVMGETSHKSMRAADMDDVIFSGNNSRPPRNTAEVGIRINNADRSAPAQFNEDETLDVSRRIERDEGSTYRVNGKEVRARDVQMLFADASTGSRSPALVHQGRIGEIIQAKPEQRRRVLEEAAGISGLHARRHEAELRLRAAEQNLARLEDVIGQLAGQIDGLKRQARQAVRYRAVSLQVRKAEATLFHLRYVNATAEVADAEHARDVAVRTVAERTGAQAEASTKQANAASALPALRDAEAKAGAALHRLIVARETLDREEARAQERMAELDRRLVQIAEDIEREKKLDADAESALARLVAEQTALDQAAADSAERRNAVNARAIETEAGLAATERTFGELTAAQADLTARRTQLEQAAREYGERRTRLERELTSVESDIAKLVEDAAAVADLEGAAAAVTAAQDAIAAAEAETLRAEAAHSAARQALDVVRQPFSDAERRAHRLEAEAKTLAKLLHVETKNLWPPVMDQLTVEKGFETALGAALGDDLEAPIDAKAPMHWAGAEPDGDFPLPDGVIPLSQHVTAPAEMARRMAQIGMTTRAQGPVLAKLLKPGQRLVSPEGDLWRWDGFAVAANAPTGAARRLAERNRLADVEAELKVARSELDGRRNALDTAAQDVAAAETAETAARTKWRDHQREADAARERHAAAEREINRVTARRSALTEAHARLSVSLTEAEASRHETDAQLAGLAPPAELETRLVDVRGKLTEERIRAAEVRAEAQALTREAEMAESRLTALKSEMTEWTGRRDGARAQTATLQTRTEETTAERKGLEDAPQQFAQKRNALIGEIGQAETTRKVAADALAEGEKAQADADRAARAALEAMGAAREELARAEERHEGSKRRLTDISHEIREVLEVDPDGVMALAGIEPGTDPGSVTETEAELEKLRRERERLGAVNLRAEEELHEVEEQHGKLTAERDDLVEAIKRLRQGIQNLNREARERLLASFEVVNAHFKRLFSELFGGGTAELQLIENDDPLEAGLDILAKPPGKKPATLSLLSGGEQALTALALIFAVFLTNPAPICVLDEVDAPLDDHNVDRFCDLLQDMTKSTETRFVIITHNPITMARMNRLFGVTMAERGVSQLVSVDLDNAVKILEAV